MASQHPISDLEELLTVIVPADVTSDGDAVNDEIDNAYIAFQEYVISSLPFELSEQDREEVLFAIGDDAEVGPNFSIGEAFAEVENLLNGIGIRERGERGMLPVNCADNSISISQLLKSLDRFDIDSLPIDKRNEAITAAFLFRSDVVLSAIQFAERIVNLYSNWQSKAQCIPEFFENVRFSNQQLRRICDSITRKGLLDASTNDEDFVYFFSGEGNVPFRRLRWTGKTVGRLTIFLSLMSQDAELWYKASKVFETRGKDTRFSPATQKILSQSAYRVRGEDSFLSQQDELKSAMGIF